MFNNRRPNFNHLLPNQQMQLNESKDDESSIAGGGAMYESCCQFATINESREYENQESSESTNESTSKTSESTSKRVRVPVLIELVAAVLLHRYHRT